MGITIHYINNNWDSEFKLLDMIDLKESHSGLYLFKKLNECLEKFEVEKRIIR